MPLTHLAIENNFFTYNNIDDHLITYISNIPNFQYSPQLTQDTEQTVPFTPGDDITLTMTDTPIPSGMNRSSFAPNTYQWYKDGNEIVGATALTYTITSVQATDEGIYVGKITNVDAPTFEYATPPITLENSLSIDTQDLDKLAVYPNPVKNHLHVDFNTISGPYFISIYDLMGKRMYTQKVNSNKSLDISFLSQGMYVVEIKTSRFSITKRIIKE